MSRPADGRPVRGLRSRCASALLAVWLGALTAGAESAEPRWFAGTLRVSTGFDWSTGSYGSSPDTTILYVPSTISYRWERFPVTATPLDELELRVTVPYLRVDGPGVIIDQGSVVPPGFDAATREGIGDVVVRATWRLLPRANSRLPMFELGGRLKVPTADRDLGLGTGELDTAVQAGLADRFGALSVFGHAGYRFLGDPPNVNLSDGPFASVGASLRFAERYGAGIAYDWRTAATPGTEDAHELVPFGSVDVGQFRVGPYAVFGFSDGSPDFGAGLQLSVEVPVR